MTTPTGPGAPRATPALVLTVVGCRAGMPADGWPSSGYILDTGGERLLLDCGPGTATALDRHLVPAELSAVLLSHLHLDHCFDLVVLGKQLVHRGGGRRVPLAVPRGATRVLRHLNHLFPVGGAPADDLPLDQVFDAAFDVTEYEPGETFAVDGCSVTPVAMVHRIPSCGFRVQTATAAFAYPGDTGATPAIEALASGVDLLLIEATLPRPDTTGHGHLSAGEAGAAAAAAGAKRLVLTHLVDASPAWATRVRDDAAAHFAGPIEVATPGARFVVETP